MEGRILRLLKIMRELKINPTQSMENILKSYEISRSQFYKDRLALAELGFEFKYHKKTGFKIIRDKLMPILGLSLSDRVTLLFALENLSAAGDGMLAAKALEVGRKLSGGLESPFREQIMECFDNEVTQKAYGVRPEIFNKLIEAIGERRRIKILYYRSGTWTESWRLVDPKRIYMRERTLYLYAKTADEQPRAWKVFRLNRIRALEPTGVSFFPRPDENDGFMERARNAFSTFLGECPRKITIRFTGDIIPYVTERLWHHSQTIEKKEDGSILFTVYVAVPEEVERWAKQFGNNARVIEME